MNTATMQTTDMASLVEMVKTLQQQLAALKQGNKAARQQGNSDEIHTAKSEPIIWKTGKRTKFVPIPARDKATGKPLFWMKNTKRHKAGDRMVNWMEVNYHQVGVRVFGQWIGFSLSDRSRLRLIRDSRTPTARRTEDFVRGELTRWIGKDDAEKAMQYLTSIPCALKAAPEPKA